MKIFTLDKSAFVRGLITPTDEAITQLIVDGGNNEFEHVGHDHIGFPIVKCEHRPKDSAVHGCTWIELPTA